MPGGYGTYGPWGSSGETYSQPEPSWQPSGGGNRPPTERVWEEEREDEPTVSVDYTTPSDYIASSSDTSSPIVPFEEIPIGSTGMGVEDLKVQAQQKRAAEQKQKYIDKLSKKDEEVIKDKCNGSYEIWCDRNIERWYKPEELV